MTVPRDDVVSSHVPRQIQNPTIIGVFYARPVVARGVVLGSHDTYIESDSDGTCCTSNLRVDFRVADNAREFTQEVVADGGVHRVRVARQDALRAGCAPQRPLSRSWVNRGPVF